jgi:endonuclease/exonuclease/phosphatase (EEP) superfamily protein YafD
VGQFFLVFSLLLIILSLLPFIKNQHWIFRVPEFLKIQLFIFQIMASIGLFIFTKKDIWFWFILLFQIVLMIYHAYLFARFIKFKPNQNKQVKLLKEIKIISANIYQFNKEYIRFKDFIRKEKPDIFVTIESNKDWELALRALEIEYPFTEKITLENTYGMHLYARIPIHKVTTHYFVADDIPSIEAHFKTEDGEEFVVFCAHPPPPSPTEEKTSKERDGDLMCIAKRTKELKKPTLVIGDFNTVAWSKISRLFQKNSELIDGRTGRGILATYHAKYWLFRAPLDLIFHSTTIFIKELIVSDYIGSDHFPICCIFCIKANNSSQEKQVETITKGEEKETALFIKKGKKEDSNNRKV